MFLLAVALVVIVACGGAASQRLAPVGNAVTPPDEFGGGQAAPAASAAPSGAPVLVDQVGNLADDAKIVRTGTIELQVADVPAALLAARDGVRRMGGYIGASQTENVDDRPVATITYRVPVDRWEDALDLLRGIAGPSTKVVNERTNAVEVTSAVVDLEARIKNLRAQLTAVRGQIEQLTAQLTAIEDQASYATLTAGFSTPVVAVQVAAKGWEPAAVVDEATASLVDILQALTTAGIWFAIVWLPLIIVIGVLAVIVIAILRRLGLIGIGRRRGDVAAPS
jgi:hypothetical protein